jgi:O-methyltransferase domain
VILGAGPAGLLLGNLLHGSGIDCVIHQSFALLGHTLRTGQEAFARLYGQGHFDYFARRPELAELFDQSMAASSRMFDPIPDHPVFAAAAAGDVSGIIVDIAGGTGQLLGRILTARPRLRGILLERPHAIAAARRP